MPLGTPRGVLGAVWDTPEGLLDISCGLEHCQHKQAVTSQSFKHHMKINVCVASPGPPGRPFSTSWGLLSLLGASWEPDGATWAALRGLLARLTLSEAVLGAFLGRLGALLERFSAVLEPSWEPLRRSWGPLGPTWGPLGGLLGCLGAILEAS